MANDNILNGFERGNAKAVIEALKNGESKQAVFDYAHRIGGGRMTMMQGWILQELCLTKNNNLGIYDWVKQKVADDEKIINDAVDCFITGYINAGGKEKDADRNITYWTLRGIYEREGKTALDEFVKNFKYHIPKPQLRGYA